LHDLLDLSVIKLLNVFMRLACLQSNCRVQVINWEEAEVEKSWCISR